MAKVIAWPPVGLTAWELTRSHPVSRSQDVFGRPDRTSSAGAPRYLATATVSGLGADGNGAGYVEMLKDKMQGGAHFVRVPAMAPVWYLPATQRKSLTSRIINWMAGGSDLYWTAGGDDMLWLEQMGITGTPSNDGPWPALRVTGLPAGVQIRPSEWIEVRSGDATETRRSLTAAMADADGNALIRLDDAFAFGGIVSIGGKRGLVFQAEGMPRAVQPASGDWSFEWHFREVFADEVGGFEDVDPWR